MSKIMTGTISWSKTERMVENISISKKLLTKELFLTISLYFSMVLL